MLSLMSNNPASGMQYQYQPEHDCPVCGRPVFDIYLRLVRLLVRLFQSLVNSYTYYQGGSNESGYWRAQSYSFFQLQPDNSPPVTRPVQTPTEMQTGIGPGLDTNQAYKDEIDKMFQDPSYIPSFTDDSTGLPYPGHIGINIVKLSGGLMDFETAMAYAIVIMLGVVLLISSGCASVPEYRPYQNPNRLSMRHAGGLSW